MTIFLKKPKASISVTLSKDMISLGEELTGGLLIKSEETFDADEIRVELMGIAPKAISNGEGGRYDCTLWWIIERLSGPLHLTPEYEQEYSFSIKIPENKGVFIRYGEPWVKGWKKNMRGTKWLQQNPKYRSKLKWTVKGVIDIKQRRDVTSSTNFKVLMPLLTLEEKQYVQTRDAKQKVATILLIGTVCLLVGLFLYGRSFISPIFAQNPNERRAGIGMSLIGFLLIIIGIYKSRKLSDRRGILRMMADLFSKARYSD